MARLAGPAQQPKRHPLQVRKDLHVYRTMDRKNPKVRKDLNILRAVSELLIKVLADLKKRRSAFFYRHLGPHGPKEVPPLHPDLLRLTPRLS